MFLSEDPCIIAKLVQRGFRGYKCFFPQVVVVGVLSNLYLNLKTSIHVS